VRTAYDSQPSTQIEQVRKLHSADTAGITVQRTLVRYWSRDDRGRVLMTGSDADACASIFRCTICRE
jgi:hypothetical protein